MHEERFRFAGRVVSCERCGSGHINGTYLVRTDAPKKYIMQEINRQYRDVIQPRGAEPDAYEKALA